MAPSLVSLYFCAIVASEYFLCHAYFVASRIHEAAVVGDEEALKQLIERGANVDARAYDKQTPVHEAAHYGQFAIAEILLRNGANINAKDTKKWTPLHEAAQNGHVKVAEFLIQNGADVNAQNKDKSTPLHFACKYGHKKVVELLLKNGARCNMKDAKKWTPLFKAAFNDHADIAELLINRGAGILVKDSEGRTPLDVAMSQRSTSVIDLLQAKSISYVRPAVKACQSYVKQQNERMPIEFPWMAALGYLIFQSASYEVTFDCSGVVISEFFVLTAAHCVKPSRAPVVVRFGKVKDGIAPINHQIKTIIRHPNYSDVTETNDIALIEILQKIYFTNDVAPACLQVDLTDERPNVELTAIGWKSGQLDVANELLKTQLKTMPLGECKETVSNYKQIVSLPGLEDGISDSQYCAYDPEGRSGKCHGENATILQHTSSNERVPSVLGVINFAIGCSPDLPAIYTRVAYFTDWIEENVWQQN